MATVETFKIKAESLPQRCEICHQDDLFEPLSGHCSRCSAIIPIPPVLPPLPEGDFDGLWSLGDTLVMVVSSGFAVVALLVFAFFSLLPLDEGENYVPIQFVIDLGGMLLLSTPGIVLLPVYVQVYRERLNALQVRNIWVGTVGYNLLALVLVALYGFACTGFIDTFPGTGLLFMPWPILMVIYGLFSIRRFPGPEAQPVNDSE
jgi:hypothetical protein